MGTKRTNRAGIGALVARVIRGHGPWRFGQMTDHAPDPAAKPRDGRWVTASQAEAYAASRRFHAATRAARRGARRGR